MNTVSAFIGGLVFGIGLIIAGMANPAKVLAFLDVAGNWDPSLALVMAGAIGVGVIAFTIAKKRKTSMLGLPMQLPNTTHIDARLLIGSTLFGVGWGLAGICPGPALVLLGTGTMKSVIFVVALLMGMALFELIGRFK